MGCQNWLHICPPIFHAYFWQSRWCEDSKPPPPFMNVFATYAKVETYFHFLKCIRQVKIFFFVNFFYDCLNTWQCTKVGRAFLNNFQKIFLNKVFIKIKIARKFRFYMWMIISGSKSVKRGQKNTEKAKTWNHTWFFQKIFALANLIYINSYMRKKRVMLLYDFRTYFYNLVSLRHHFRIYYQQLSTTL